MKRRTISCFVGILCVFLLVFHLPVGAAEGTVVFRDNGGGSVRLFARVNGTAVAVISSGGTYFATTGGSVLVSGSSCDRAVHNNGVIVLLFGNGGSTRVALAGTGGIYTEFSIPQPVGAVRGYAMAGSTFWCCVGKELQVYDTAGTLQKSYALPAAANSLAVTSGGRVLVFCGNGTTYAADGIPESLAAISSSGTNPLVSLGNDWFADAYGHICYYSGGSIYGTGIVGAPPRTTDYAACGVSDVAAYAESGSLVAYHSLSTGERLGSISFDGSVKALAGGAVLLCKENVYSIVFPAYATATPTPIPTPTPGPSPTPSPAATPSSAPVSSPAATHSPTASTAPTKTPAPTVIPTATAAPTKTPVPTVTPTATAAPTPASSGDEQPLPEGVRLLDEFALVPAGTTAAQLRKADDVEEVFFADGARASGNCRTGMQLLLCDGRALPVVVPGDANGSGTVNTADITALQKHILGEETLSGVYFTAADLDENKVLNTADLVRLAALLV